MRILIFSIVIISGLSFTLWRSSGYHNPFLEKNNRNTEMLISQLYIENGISKVISIFETAKYIDNQTFSMIKDAYDDINFFGYFNQGNITYYDDYKRLFKRLIDGEETLTIKRDIETKRYINEFGFLSDDYGISKYELDYIYFDMDGDEAPELCIKDNANFTYIIDYDEEKKEFVLWKDYNIEILGTKKLAVYSYPIYRLLELDEHGNEERMVRFEEYGYTNSNTKKSEVCYLVALPYKSEEELKDLPASLKEKAFFYPDQGYYYFRVTKEQYDELTKDFYDSTKLASEQIKDVTYTYDELFGSFAP